MSVAQLVEVMAAAKDIPLAAAKADNWAGRKVL